jgi:hypothetical protein
LALSSPARAIPIARPRGASFRALALPISPMSRLMKSALSAAMASSRSTDVLANSLVAPAIRSANIRAPSRWESNVQNVLKANLSAAGAPARVAAVARAFSTAAHATQTAISPRHTCRSRNRAPSVAPRSSSRSAQKLARCTPASRKVATGKLKLQPPCRKLRLKRRRFLWLSSLDGAQSLDLFQKIKEPRRYNLPGSLNNSFIICIVNGSSAFRNLLSKFHFPRIPAPILLS